MSPDMINLLIIVIPTVIFGLLLGFGIIFGIIRGFRKSLILGIQALVAFAIVFVFFMVFIFADPDGKKIVSATNGIAGNGWLQSTIASATNKTVSTSTVSLKEILMELIPQFMDFKDAIQSVIVENGAYVMTLVNFIIRFVYAIISLIIYLLLVFIFYIIYVIFYPERRHKRRVERKYERLERDKPYKKRRLLGLLIGTIRGLISSLTIAAFIGSILFMVTGSDGNKKYEDSKVEFSNKEFSDYYNMYQAIESYGSNGIYKVLGVLKNKDQIPYYLYITEMFYSGHLTDTSRNIDNQNIWMVEEVGAYTKFVNDITDLVIKYGFDELDGVLTNPNDQEKINALVKALDNEKFQEDFDKVIDDFDAKTYFSNFALSLVDSIAIHIDGLTEGMDATTANILKILFTGNAIEGYETGENLAHLTPSDLLSSDDAKTLLKVTLPLVLSNAPSFIEYATNSDNEPPLKEIISILKGILPEFKNMSALNDETKATNLNNTLERLYQYMDKVLAEKIDEKTSASGIVLTKFNLVTETTTSGTNWVDEIQNLLDVGINVIKIAENILPSSLKDIDFVDLLLNIFQGEKGTENIELFDAINKNDSISYNKVFLYNISKNFLNLYKNNFDIKYFHNIKVDKNFYLFINKNTNENGFSKQKRYLSENFNIGDYSPLFEMLQEIKEKLNTIDKETVVENFMLKDDSLFEEFEVFVKDYNNISMLLQLIGFPLNKNYTKKYNDYQKKINNLIDSLKKNKNGINITMGLIQNYLSNTLVNYISNLSKKDIEGYTPIINNIIDIVYEFIRDFNLREDFINKLFERELERIKIKDLLSENNVSGKCINFLNYVILGNIKNEQKDNDTNIKNEQKDNDTIKYYQKKFLEGIKDKNDFFNYEKCLKNDYKTNETKNKYPNNMPALVVSILDGTNKTKNSKKNTFFEKFYFVITYCFPQGYNETKNDKRDYFCSNEDYEKIVKLSFNSRAFRDVLSIDSTNLKVNSIILMDEGDFETKSLEVIISIIALIILLIPLIINIYLYLFKKKKNNNNNKGKIFNKLDKDEINSLDENNKNEEEDEERLKEEREEIIFPKRIILLNYFFNYRENFKELFNFKSDSNINNMNGLNYIKGLIGMSMILLVFGHIYFILFNFPLKKFGQWNLYRMMSSPFFIVPMSGLRYAPRFIISCSGFTFTYKYLSFLDKNPKNYFLKFLFQQNYKYFLLILIFLGRPLAYFIHRFFFGISPMMELLHYFLKKPEDLKEYLLSFILFNLDDDFKTYERNTQDSFDYFWLPFNEILFFILGLILISVGYKYKLRIDLIIIIFFIILYMIKILLYIIYNHCLKDNEIYPTLYYYIIDYGKLMLCPYFNLSYYLIGMYFGLMRYTVQKIMTEIEQNKNDIINLDEDNNSFKDEERKMIKNIEKNNSSKIIFYNDGLLSLENNKEKEGFDSEKDLKGKLLDSESIKIKRHLSGNISNKLFKNNNNTSKIEDNDDTSNSSKNSLNYKTNDSKNIISKRKEMPFFELPISIIKWHKNHIGNLAFFAIIIIMVIIYILLIFSYYFFFDIEVDLDKSKKNEYMKKLRLEDILTDKFFNCLYLIDIELIVILVHWAAFIISLREQNRIYDFLRNDYWNFFTKSYFSYILLLNPIILYILYGNETVISLELLSIYLYSIINLFLF